ncbi:DUF4241 domain-containing protein [Agreia sp. VKM Ac-1783]|uniref:DUF4241 domain-containing protein n=1 Tax=Agreia sp. VKM Ac-1783 TaxID=1938889 RepID=UPI000A2AE358|nr:DUF4241 domain-containing protein [Agreia sp. VKM Ac-1783]SMQ71816.1 Protein of unknown function [Agreia sp. VKM Ac-1783]
MQLSEFFAGASGPAPLVTGVRGTLTVHDLGTLRVPSGSLGAADPFVALDLPITVQIPPGAYPVTVTVADVSTEQDGSHRREAYLSLILSDAPTVDLEPVPGPYGPPEDDSYFGVAVDAGTVAFFDAAAVATSMPGDGDDWYDDVFDTGEPGSWFDIMDADAPLPAGTANIEMPLAQAGENVVLAHSGWGDGFYPVVQTRDAEGRLTGVHIDLRVVGSAPDAEPTGAAKSWIARVKRLLG